MFPDNSFSLNPSFTGHRQKSPESCSKLCGGLKSAALPFNTSTKTSTLTLIPSVVQQSLWIVYTPTFAGVAKPPGLQPLSASSVYASSLNGNQFLTKRYQGPKRKGSYYPQGGLVCWSFGRPTQRPTQGQFGAQNLDSNL